MLTPVQISQILEKLIDHKTLNLFLNIMHTVFFMLNLIIMAALRSRRGHYIFVLWFVFLSISSLAYSLHSQIGCLPHFDTWCGLSANLGCRSEMCCTRLSENTGAKKSPKIRHLLTITQLCRAMSSQLRHISTIEKELLNSNISLTCPHNMANFGPLAAEIVSLVWGTPANFNGFRVLAGLLHGTLLMDVSQTLRRWTEGAITLDIGSHSLSFFFFMVALRNRADHYIFAVVSFFFLLSFFFSPILSGHRLDVYHTFIHGVALVRI